MSIAPYRLKRPIKRTSCVVFSSPHSGRAYPREMLDTSVLDSLALRSSEDAYVDRLFDAAPLCGAAMLSAVFPRAWVDLNRRHDEFDPALIEDVSQSGPNPRISSGLGVIPRVVAGGRCIYRGKISRAEAEQRVQSVWRPYHQILETLLTETRALFGQAVLLDCHSMPREALRNARAPSGQRPEIVIGDRFGASASPNVIAEVESVFRGEGFVVARNVPFAGAYITQHYGRPSQGRHAVQVEVDRTLYMDEKTLMQNDGYADVKDALDRVTRRIAAYGAEQMPLAAE